MMPWPNGLLPLISEKFVLVKVTVTVPSAVAAALMLSVDAEPAEELRAFGLLL